MGFWAAGRVATVAGDADLGPRQREVLSTVAALGEAAVEQIRQRLQNPPGVRMVQRLVATLVGSGRVTRTGKGRSTRYRSAG